MSKPQVHSVTKATYKYIIKRLENKVKLIRKLLIYQLITYILSIVCFPCSYLSYRQLVDLYLTSGHPQRLLDKLPACPTA